MSLHSDLLEQANHLAAREPKRPKQASLRRATSTAYYALFHFLVDEATRYLVGGGAQRERLRSHVARSFEHRQMKDAAQKFLRGSHPWALQRDALPREVFEIANAFVSLQQERHDADYNRERTFYKTEAQALIRVARSTMAEWRRVRTKESSRVFLAALAFKARQ